LHCSSEVGTHPITVKVSETGGKEPSTILARHAAFFAALGERAELGIHGPEEVKWRRQLEPDHGNLRTALAWGEERDPALMLWLAGAPWRFWWIHLTEGKAWLERAGSGR
jgi:predicted ATPase